MQILAETWEVRKTASRAPLMNSTCERFIESVCREWLDHVLISGEAHMKAVLCEYVAYFNDFRPRQGLEQRVPVAGTKDDSVTGGQVHAVPVLGGLHHDHMRAA